MRMPRSRWKEQWRAFMRIQPLGPGQARWTWVVLLWTVYHATLYAQSWVTFAIGRAAGDWGDYWKAGLAYQGSRTVFWILATFPLLALIRRVAARSPGVAAFAAVHVLAAAVASVAANLFMTVAASLLLARPLRVTARSLFDGSLLPSGIWRYAMLLAASYALGYWLNYRAAALRAERLRAQAAAAEVRALNSRIDSEFVLGSLRAFVQRADADPAAATELIAHLGFFLRYRTNAPGREHVSLRVELDGLRAYLGVERARTGRALPLALDVGAEALEWPVPPMLLQPLGQALAAADDPRARLTLSALQTGVARRLSVDLTPGPIPAGLALPVGARWEGGTLLLPLPLPAADGEPAAPAEVPRPELAGALP